MKIWALTVVLAHGMQPEEIAGGMTEVRCIQEMMGWVQRAEKWRIRSKSNGSIIAVCAYYDSDKHTAGLYDYNSLELNLWR